MNLFDLTGKVAVITGGAGVLGGSMAEYLGRQGVKIAILDRDSDRVAARVAELENAGIEVQGLVSDVLNQEALETAASGLKWDRLDILINAAGGNMPGATIAPTQTFFDMSYPDFKKVNELNLHGSVLPSMVFGKLMATQKAGTIINISSMSAMQAITRVVGYSASKAAIDIFTKWLATELAIKYGENMRVNAIAPGFFIGEQNRALLLNPDGSLTERGKTIIAKTPMQRFGEADELHGTIHWLCADASKFVTGTIIPIDGGFSAFSGV
jgi:NAD(P)-dependent dehydrogenase (short-subunit alcohol dehydrogenase family)